MHFFFQEKKNLKAALSINLLDILRDASANT